MIGKTISHYRILDKLGEGGMGVVYKAEDIKLERVVALKFLPQHLTDEAEEKKRFVQEAKAASGLNHPNIATIYEIDEYEEQIFMAMEYVEGKTLKQTIGKEPLPIKDVLNIGIQICEGLNMAHEKGIVHRDIKSSNIMLTSRDQVKIMDFGLAKLKGAADGTDTRSTLGTTAYMSPEQAQGEEVDQRTDIFSCGVVLYELLTGRLPFEGEHQVAIIYSILSEEPPSVVRFNNQVSARLEDMVFKALSKDRGERYQHTDDLLADLRREKKNLEYTKTTRIPTESVLPKTKKNLSALVATIATISVLVLLFLFLKVFRSGVGPGKELQAASNILAVMYFENLKDREDEKRIGEMISELLITDLSESQYMRVISSQRLFDILKMMGKEGHKVVDRTVASEVAHKAQAKYMLLGKILSTEPDLIITSQLVDVESGNVIASQRVSGPDGTNIFVLVDSLSLEIRKDLELPALAQKQDEKPVADITTQSPDALRLYLEGNELFNKVYMKDAAKKFEQAVKIDTTFASAYLKLSFCYSSLHDIFRAKKYIAKATQFSDRVSRKEKYLIDAYVQLFQSKYKEAQQTLKDMTRFYPDEKTAYEELAKVSYSMGNYEEAIINYKKVIQLDSLDKLAHNMLAYAYDEMGRYDEAIRAINRYIELAPDEANPYDTRGDLYAYHSEVDKAIESYEKALEIKPEFTVSIQKIGFMYLNKREYEKAEQYFQRYGDVGTKMDESISQTCLALIPLSQGKYNRALDLFKKGIAADELEELKLHQHDKHMRIAIIYAERKDFEKSLQHGKKLIQLMKEAYPEDVFLSKIFYGMFLALAGEIDSAQAISKEVEKIIQDKTKNQKASWYFLEFLINYHKGNFDQALKIARLAEDDFRIRFWKTKALLEKEMIGDAVKELETLSKWNILEKVRLPIFSFKIPYLLGISYERSGWKNKAIAQYEEFLKIMKDADPGIPEVEDAKERIKKLRV
ncbi:MAG: FlgO family outer membrane protein [Candidatus Zixiibacteriota bacterium]